jgi:type II secretory pathway pseudopilin PulG
VVAEGVVELMPMGLAAGELLGLLAAMAALALSSFATQAQPQKELAAQSQLQAVTPTTRSHRLAHSLQHRRNQYGTFCTNQREQRRPASSGY